MLFLPALRVVDRTYLQVVPSRGAEATRCVLFLSGSRAGQALSPCGRVVLTDGDRTLAMRLAARPTHLPWG